jgi:ligand-binding sensor domain-containing protein
VSPTLDESQLLHYEKGDPNEGTNNTIIGIHYSSVDDTVWLGTRVGLAKVNDSADALESVAFAGTPIYSVRNDSQGNLLIGTVSDGTYHYDPSTNSVVAHFKSDRVLGMHVASVSG